MIISEKLHNCVMGGIVSSVRKYNHLCLGIRSKLKELKNELENVALFLYLKHIKNVRWTDLVRFPDEKSDSKRSKRN